LRRSASSWSRDEALAMPDVADIATLVEDWMEELPTAGLAGQPREW
jgi:hypothetical protein